MGNQDSIQEVGYDCALACELAPAIRMIYMQEIKSRAAVAVFCADENATALLASEQAMEAHIKAMSPEQCKHCGEPLRIKSTDDLVEAFGNFEKTKSYVPKIVAVEGLGIFVLGESKAAAEATKQIFFGTNSDQSGTCSSLGARRLEGKIAIVTGSAQGFGKGIAQSMAAQGAYVVIADMNKDGAQACADELCAANGAHTAIAVAVNVADEDSVAAMVKAAVLNYGGLDVFVSNAGIAIAGSLAEMTRQKFDLVTSVNYTGYFLCTKYACVPMKIQRKYNHNYLMDIIEINSKSGLEGSNKNFAYAGSKFGGVGLTQSFALELVEYGIKVNAICPGNLLDGPLWSDPEKGLFKQYFEAGKVPGAKSIADVRKFYESKVPMNRGCTTDDVACAIMYVVEQKYETGQAIPVTGGQIMLK